VRRRKLGREHMLALNPKPLDAASDWLDQQRALWAWRLGELDTILKEDKP